MSYIIKECDMSENNRQVSWSEVEENQTEAIIDIKKLLEEYPDARYICIEPSAHWSRCGEFDYAGADITIYKVDKEN